MKPFVFWVSEALHPCRELICPFIFALWPQMGNRHLPETMQREGICTVFVLEPGSPYGLTESGYHSLGILAFPSHPLILVIRSKLEPKTSTPSSWVFQVGT